LAQGEVGGADEAYFNSRGATWAHARLKAKANGRAAAAGWQVFMVLSLRWCRHDRSAGHEWADGGRAIRV
jgi:drug/metabolite transporter superfamily protein YnfA